MKEGVRKGVQRKRENSLEKEVHTPYSGRCTDMAVCREKTLTRFVPRIELNGRVFTSEASASAKIVRHYGFE